MVGGSVLDCQSSPGRCTLCLGSASVLLRLLFFNSTHALLYGSEITRLLQIVLRLGSSGQYVFHQCARLLFAFGRTLHPSPFLDCCETERAGGVIRTLELLDPRDGGALLAHGLRHRPRRRAPLRLRGGLHRDVSIIQIEASDPDTKSSDKLAYKITSGNPQGFFSINPKTGLVSTTSRKLDREQQDEHILEVNALPSEPNRKLSRSDALAALD
ncbi:hypothetical protein AOLI_G00199450 [Acnodon oligacanthus]